MAYDLKITGLANKDALKAEGPKAHRLYKFALNQAPDGLWVLLLQQAGRDVPDVTVSGNAGQTELWASANADVSVKRVLEGAKRAVKQANADANASDAQFNRAAEEEAASVASFQQQLVAEIDELSFDDDEDSSVDSLGSTSAPREAGDVSAPAAEDEPPMS